MRNTVFRLVLIIVIMSGSSATGWGADKVIFQLKSDSPILSGFAKAGDKLAGHREGIERLRSNAEISQAGIINVLEALEARGEIESYRRFWIANVVMVAGPKEVIDRLAQRPDIVAVYDDLPISLVDPVETGEADILSEGHEVGLDIVGAPDVWRMGLDGSGSLVCNFDTGVDGDHPALEARYRGNNGADPAECWFDPYTNTQYPSDLHGHGSHTMGTMIGADISDTVGVAPGAQWIAAGVVDRGGGID
ncbi:MAG: S8 family serine peptidase, partial [candidate division Zixibacteria bacterium]